MPTQYVRRGTTANSGQSNTADASLIYVDRDTETLKFGAASTGQTEKEAVDTTSSQTLTNKTLTGAVVSRPLVDYTADGAIAATSHIAVISKAGSAAAMTLAAPASDGIEIYITAGSSFAHVTTATNLFWAGETGGPFNLVTLAAFIGSSAHLISYGGLWNVVSDQTATVGD